MKAFKCFISFILVLLLAVPITAELIFFTCDQMISADTAASSLSDKEVFPLSEQPQLSEFFNTSDINSFMSPYVASFFSSYLLGTRMTEVTEADVKDALYDYIERSHISDTDIGGSTGTYTGAELKQFIETNSASYALAMNDALPDKELLPDSFGPVKIDTVQYFLSDTMRVVAVLAIILFTLLIIAARPGSGAGFKNMGFAAIISSGLMFAAAYFIRRYITSLKYDVIEKLSYYLIINPIFRAAFVGLGGGALLVVAGVIVAAQAKKNGEGAKKSPSKSRSQAR